MQAHNDQDDASEDDQGPLEGDVNLSFGPDGVEVSFTSPKGPGGLATVAAVCAVAPFFAHFTINGFDFVKLVGGGLAVILGIAGVALGALRKPRRWPMASLSALAIVVGCAQLLLSGFVGMIVTGVLDDTEEHARSELVTRGMEAIELDGADGDFQFSAEHDGQYCTGSVVVSRELFSSSSSVVYDCGLPMPIERLEQRCGRNDGEACAEAAERLRHQEPPDWPRAIVLARRGCEQGAADGCFVWAYGTEDGSGGESADPSAAEAIYARGCAGDSAPSCFNRGVLLLHGRGIEHDPAAACDSFEHACQLAARYCGAYGECFRDAAGRPADMAQARRLFHRACEADDEASCTNEAATYLDGPDADMGRALSLYGRACDLHESTGCRMQARLLIDGPEGSRDPQTGAARLAEMCERGDGDSCFYGGLAFHTGSGPLERDRSRAYALFQKGCELNEADSCRNVGVYLRDHLGGPRATREEVRAAFARACELGNRRACNEP